MNGGVVSGKCSASLAHCKPWPVCTSHAQPWLTPDLNEGLLFLATKSQRKCEPNIRIGFFRWLKFKYILLLIFGNDIKFLCLVPRFDSDRKIGIYWDDCDNSLDDLHINRIIVWFADIFPIRFSRLCRMQSRFRRPGEHRFRHWQTRNYM